MKSSLWRPSRLARVHAVFCLSAAISKPRPPVKSSRPAMSVMATERGSVASRVAGIELSASTGSRQMLTQDACRAKAVRNLGGDSRMAAKRESEPEAEMRWYRYVPTVFDADGLGSRWRREDHVAESGKARSPNRLGRSKTKSDIHRVAHIPTAALSTTCLQFQPALPARPISAALTLGHPGLTVPAAVAAARARRTGRYKLNPVHER